MSDIKRGANVAGTVPATGPAAIRTTALLPGNRTSNMTIGTGAGGGSNRTGVGVGSGSSKLANSHMASDVSPTSLPQGSIRLDPSRHAEIIAMASSSPSTSSSHTLKTVSASIKPITSSIISSKITNNVGHDEQEETFSSTLVEIPQNRSVISNATQHNESHTEDKTSDTDDEGPNRKKLKLDVNAANAARDRSQFNSKGVVRRHRLSGESLLDRRKRIQEHRKSRLQRLHKNYSQNATEHYFIQNHVPPGSFVDLQAFRKKPNLPFLNYLKANKAPSDILQEVALVVLGHTNSSEMIDENSTNNSASNAGKTSYENHSPTSINNITNVQTLTVKRPSSKPSLQQSNSSNTDKGILFSPLNHCGRVTSAAMAQAIHIARKSKTNQSPQVLHPFSTLDYDTNTHINKTNNVDVSQDSLPALRPSKFPPYSPKILSGSELGGVMYGPKLGSFPPTSSSSSALMLPTVPMTPTFSELQSRIPGSGIPNQRSSSVATAPSRLTSLFKSTLPRYPREQFTEKCRQEPFVVRTIAHLSKEGLWSQRRLPKVCERPRPKTHWDGMLNEMQWLAVDYHQERKWKKAAAKILAYSAKEFVSQWDERKRLRQEQREKNSRAVAKFVSDEILRFWQAIKSLQYTDELTDVVSQRSCIQQRRDLKETNSNLQSVSNNSGTDLINQRNRNIISDCSDSTNITLNNIEGLQNKKIIKRRSTSSNGSNNCTSIPLNALTCITDMDKDDDVELFELSDNEINASDDDEITIEEQEAYEAENTLIDRRLEWDTLSSDNQKSVEVILRSNYVAYLNALNDNALEDPDFEDSSGVEDGGSDSDDDTVEEADDENDEQESEFEMDSFNADNHHDFDLEAVEKALYVPLSSKQRQLYDDYMAGPDVRKALEGDGQTLSTVLNNLRKICNHPNLISTPKISEKCDPAFSLSFPLVIDHQYWHPMFLHAIEYDPWSHVDLSSLNMVYFDHEFTLTAITSDRIRKCCASRKLIEELASTSDSSVTDNTGHSTLSKKPLSLGPPVPSNRLKLEIQPTTNTSNNTLSSINGGGQASNSGTLFNQHSRFSQNQTQPHQTRGDQQQLVQTINGQHMFYTSTLIDKVPPTTNLTVKVSLEEKCVDKMEHNHSEQKVERQKAFHEDSLYVIARFNERRCNGMPLFGRDLVDALTVVDSVRPVRTCRLSTQSHLRHKGVGYVNCLNAMPNVTNASILRPRKRSKIAKEDPEYRYQTNALKELITTVNSSAQIHSEWCEMTIKLPTPVLLTSVNWNTQLHRRYSRQIFPALQKLSKEMNFSAEIALHTPTLLPTMYGSSAGVRLLRLSSSKLQQLDCLLREVRNKQERVLVFCQMPQMIELLENFFKQHHIKFISIENSASNKLKIKKIELFSNRRNILVLLTSTSTPPPPPSTACLWPNNLSNVVFFDSNWNNTVNTNMVRCSTKAGNHPSSLAPCLAWCRQLNHRMAFLPLLESPIQSKAFFSFPRQTPSLKVYRLVCEETVEDNISKKTLQQKLLGDLKLRNNNRTTTTTGDVNEGIIDKIDQSTLGTGYASKFWKIKRQTLEDLLFNNQHPQALPIGGDNGIFGTTSESTQGTNKVTTDKNSLLFEELLNDVEAIAQLDWLWTSKLKENLASASSLNDVVEMAQVELNNVDGCDNIITNDDYLLQTNKFRESQPIKVKIKPIERYALNFCTRIQAEIENEYAIPNDEYQELSPSLKYRCPSLKLSQNREILNKEESKLHWELQYQSQLAELESEKAHLDSLPLIVYSTEDGGRASSKSWHGRDGQPMGIWTPPMPSTMHQLLQDPSGTELSFNYLSYLYDTDMLNLMDDTELPPVYVKKELAPMNIKLEPMLGTNLHGLSPSGEMTALNPIDYKTKIRNENYGPLAGMIPGPTYAPRSLFDRPVNPQKVRPKVPRPHPQPGTGRDGLPSKVPPLPFHPLPRPQVEAENVPDWLVSEDWALLTAVRDLLELPLNLQATSPAHTPNWDMVADMVNSVSYVYRGPRQCRNRYETIVVPREEGRILFDLSSIAPPDLSQIGTPTSKKKKKQEKKNLSQPLPKPNRPIKTATLFKQDDNRAWTQMFGNRFGSIKAVALKRAPTTKPLVVNPVPKNSKHAQVLSESGISYDAPLNPISVAANRAERIQKEKQRTQQDQQQQRLATAQQVASAVQQTAAAQRTAAVAVQQHQSQGTLVTAPRGVTVASLPVQATQQQQATVVQASVTPGQQSSIQGPQAVVVGISQPITSVTNTQHVVQQQAQHQNVLQTTGRNLQQIGVQELIRVSQQQAQSAHQAQQPTVVVSGQHQQPTSVGTVINLTPSQMQAAQKLVGQSSVVTTRVAGTASGGLVSFAGKQLTPQQFNALRQQALLKKNQQDAQTAAAIAKARLQGLQPTAVPQATAVTLSAAGGQVQQAGTIMGQATTSTGQKVSVAVTPGGAVSIANVANAVSASGNVVVTSPMTGAVTVVTQASGQPKAHLIRQVNSMGKGTVRAFSDSEMKLLLQKQQQHQLQQQSGQTKTQIQLPTHVTSSTGNTAITAQLLAQHGIQVQQTPGGPSVATLVKTSTAGASSSGLPTQSVTIPVAAGAMNLPQIRAALTRSGVTNPQQMQLLQKQLLQRQQIAKQQGIAVGQAGKGMPAQLIVSSGGNPVAGQKQGLPQSVSVQQIQQIVKAGQVINATPPSSGGNATVVTQGQILPHSAILTAKTGSSPATVQARVIPVSSGALNASANAAPLGSNIGRTQQIQVVAASPNQAVNAALRQVGVASGAAPNVTVDASGRPTSGTGAASTTTTQFANAYAAAAAAGGSPTIRIQGGSGQQQQQIISQVSAALAASSSGGHPVSVAVRGPTASVLAAAQQVTQQVTATVSTAATSSSKLQPNNTVSIANTSSVTGSPSTGNEKK